VPRQPAVRPLARGDRGRGLFDLIAREQRHDLSR
jgi:hypothetical protein